MSLDNIKTKYGFTNLYQIGKGNFGVVYKGEIDYKTGMAVKVVKFEGHPKGRPSRILAQALRESDIIKQVGSFI